MNRKRLAGGVVFALLALAAASASHAQEETEEPKEDRPWSNKTEFGLTSTSGNTNTTNLSLANNFKYNWTRAEFLFDLTAIENQTTFVTYEGAPGNEFLVENKETTAAIYGAIATYRRDITNRLFWYVDGRWYRNEPSGIEDRYRGGGGLGYKIIETNKHSFLAELGGTYTEQSDTNGSSTTWTSARTLFEYDFQISENAVLESDLEGIFDVDDSDNWQANWVTSLTASLTSRLALKVSYLVVYNNLPPSRTIPPGRGTAANAPSLQFPSEKTDRFLTAALVLNF